MAQNEMRAMRGMPLRVRSMEGLGVFARRGITCSAFAIGIEKPARTSVLEFSEQSICEEATSHDGGCPPVAQAREVAEGQPQQAADCYEGEKQLGLEP